MCHRPSGGRDVNFHYTVVLCVVNMCIITPCVPQAIRWARRATTPWTAGTTWSVTVPLAATPWTAWTTRCVTAPLTAWCVCVTSPTLPGRTAPVVRNFIDQLVWRLYECNSDTEMRSVEIFTVSSLQRQLLSVQADVARAQ